MPATGFVAWRKLRAAGFVSVFALGLSSCALSGSGHPGAALPKGRVLPASANRVFLEPQQGLEPVYALIGAARSRIDMTMYELVDPLAERALAAAAARGVRVRVVLDARLEKANNTPVYASLRRQGVQVRWSDSRFPATHQKSFVVDGSVAAILTLNLASRFYATTRDFGVLTTDRADVTAIETVFEADFAGRSVRAPSGDDLVWSPDAERAFVALIDDARVSVDVESEELSDRTVVEALLRARRRGVAVSVTMTLQKQYLPNFTLLARGGVRVGYYQGERPIYVHAKALVIDARGTGARALVGSQNIGPVSLLRDRELGIVLTDPVQVAQVATVLAGDLRAAKRWAG